jgi:hypothetical protein
MFLHPVRTDLDLLTDAFVSEFPSEFGSRDGSHMSFRIKFLVPFDFDAFSVHPMTAGDQSASPRAALPK